MKRITYKDSGVDIKKADDFVKAIGSKKRGLPKAFASFFDIAALSKKYKNPMLISSADGVGTKLMFAQELGGHDTVGIDVVAMNVNDIVCLGAAPLFFLDYIACGKLNTGVLGKVVSGIKKGLNESACVLLGGETAEMPGMYDKNEYDLAGFCVGAVDKHKVVDGRNIKQGDLIIGLESSGLHSNGFSLVRKVLGKKEIKKHQKNILMPTRIYVKPVLSLLSNYPLIKGIAHITGGAFYTKATKILPQGLGMVIDKKSWKVPAIFKLIQQKGNISDKEMYSVFNMGIGMIIVVKKDWANKIATKANRFFPASIIGEIVKSKQKMSIV